METEVSQGCVRVLGMKERKGICRVLWFRV